MSETDVELVRRGLERFFGRVRAKGRGSGIEIDQPLYSVFWMREGKIVRMHSFLERDEAVRAATDG